jgi:alpha-1,3-rhamnosyl/mannosyltransferase
VVHTHSAFVAAEVIEVLGADPGRVHAVAPGIPTAGPAPAVAARAGEVDERDPRPYVLALGTVEPRKDLPTLVRAFDAVAEADERVRLVIAGAPGWGHDELDAAVRRARHGDRVARLGYVDPATRDGLLRGAAVFAFPSLYEGFGFPPLEAMAAGVPVVATRAGAVPEVLGDAACLVPPRDHVALAEALALVLTDEAVRAGLVAAGRTRTAGFSWEACALGLTALYRQAVGR